MMNFEDRYVIATSNQIHSWSYGAVERTRKAAEMEGKGERGTLNDQSIFGTRIDLQCGCKKYAGAEHEGVICDICGVKVARTTVRAERFGHINLKAEVEYSMGCESKVIHVFPVLPARYRESPSGRKLNTPYESMVEYSQAGNIKGIKESIEALKEVLLPLLQMLDSWELTERNIVARGLALIEQE